MPPTRRETALLIIDVQKAIDHPSWGVRNNPAAEQHIADLLADWRAGQFPIVHIRHDSRFPESHYRPGQRLHDFKAEARPLPGERIVGKQNHSAFAGTNLDAILRRDNITTLAICGVITNNSVEATVRHAENLGFTVFLIEDACFTFGKQDWNGVPRTAEEVHAMSLANLSEEYCTVVTTADVLAGRIFSR